MKTLSLALNVIFISVFIFYACSNSSSVGSSGDGAGACIQSTCRDYTGLPIEGLISGSVLASMTEEYKRDPGKRYVSQSASAMERSNVEDARSIWFSLDKIKQYIWYIENQLCRSDCPASRKLGIRFYYMKYPANVGTAEAPAELQDVPRNFANLHSLAMVPGYMIGDELVDFDPRFIGPGCSLRMLGKPKGQHQGGVNYADTAKIAFILKTGEGSNHGGLEPPNGDGIYGN